MGQQTPNRKPWSLRTLLVVGGGGALAACICLGIVVAGRPSAPLPTLAPTLGQEPTQKQDHVGTATIILGMTLAAPTPTSPPTRTPAPTKSPTPKPTATPLPAPVLLTGNGDSVVDFDNPFGAAIVHIMGNSGSRHFAVENFGAGAEQIGLLVNTTDPYDGIRPLDFRSAEHTVRFVVTATGDWSIEILPLQSAHSLTVPGSLAGRGDDVVLFTGGQPDTARIVGNQGERHFAVIGYTLVSSDLLVNTTDPYDGTVILDSATVILEVNAEGEWTIEIRGG